MKLHRWDDLKREKLSPEKLQAIERRAKRKALLLTLRELRQMSGKMQIDVAEVAKMTQGELSKAERREDHLLSTLQPSGGIRVRQGAGVSASGTSSSSAGTGRR